MQRKLLVYHSQPLVDCELLLLLLRGLAESFSLDERGGRG